MNDHETTFQVKKTEQTSTRQPPHSNPSDVPPTTEVAVFWTFMTSISWLLFTDVSSVYNPQQHIFFAFSVNESILCIL